MHNATDIAMALEVAVKLMETHELSSMYDKQIHIIKKLHAEKVMDAKAKHSKSKLVMPDKVLTLAEATNFVMENGGTVCCSRPIEVFPIGPSKDVLAFWHELRENSYLAVPFYNWQVNKKPKPRIR